MQEGGVVIHRPATRGREREGAFVKSLSRLQAAPFHVLQHPEVHLHESKAFKPRQLQGT